MNGYIYIVIPTDIHNHIHFELSKIGYFTTDNIEKTIHNNYSRSMGSYIIYEQISCKFEKVRHYEKVIHLMLQDYRNKPPHEVFNLSSLKAREIVKYFKEYVINTDILEEKILSKNIKINNEKNKFIEYYKINDNIVITFDKIKNKLFNTNITEDEFKKLLGNKMYFTKELYELFEKYLLIDKYNLENIENIFLIKNVLKKYFINSNNNEDYISKKEIKEILKQNKIKINDIDLIEIIKLLYDCKYYSDTRINNIRVKLIFKNIKYK